MIARSEKVRMYVLGPNPLTSTLSNLAHENNDGEKEMKEKMKLSLSFINQLNTLGIRPSECYYLRLTKCCTFLLARFSADLIANT